MRLSVLLCATAILIASCEDDGVAAPATPTAPERRAVSRALIAACGDPAPERPWTDAQRSAMTDVLLLTIDIHDTLGQRMQKSETVSLTRAEVDDLPGHSRAVSPDHLWDLRDMDGKPASPGNYVYFGELRSSARALIGIDSICFRI